MQSHIQIKSESKEYNLEEQYDSNANESIITSHILLPRHLKYIIPYSTQEISDKQVDLVDLWSLITYDSAFYL